MLSRSGEHVVQRKWTSDFQLKIYTKGLVRIGLPKLNGFLLIVFEVHKNWAALYRYNTILYILIYVWLVPFPVLFASMFLCRLWIASCMTFHGMIIHKPLPSCISITHVTLQIIVWLTVVHTKDQTFLWHYGVALSFAIQLSLALNYKFTFCYKVICYFSSTAKINFSRYIYVCSLLGCSSFM